ncbi:hypothetical protein AMC83_CH01931 [Rhizobium phaseoli]|nr:hypothetical protein AMC83_CH01931 [Rhizobium phaseoli]
MRAVKSKPPQLAVRLNVRAFISVGQALMTRNKQADRSAPVNIVNILSTKESAHDTQFCDGRILGRNTINDSIVMLTEPRVSFIHPDVTAPRTDRPAP